MQKSLLALSLPRAGLGVSLMRLCMRRPVNLLPATPRHSRSGADTRTTLSALLQLISQLSPTELGIFEALPAIA
ncbi:hypothetical protein Micbo1qcDRAFT_167258, partial [Microdochium bolleyi]